MQCWSDPAIVRVLTIASVMQSRGGDNKQLGSCLAVISCLMALAASWQRYKRCWLDLSGLVLFACNPPWEVRWQPFRFYPTGAEHQTAARTVKDTTEASLSSDVQLFLMKQRKLNAINLSTTSVLPCGWIEGNEILSQ